MYSVAASVFPATKYVSTDIAAKNIKAPTVNFCSPSFRIKCDVIVEVSNGVSAVTANAKKHTAKNTGIMRRVKRVTIKIPATKSKTSAVNRESYKT